jgi:hypothetical protein
MPNDREHDEIRDRFVYHTPLPETQVKFDILTAEILALVDTLLEIVPENSRDRALALTALEDFRMKANKAIIFAQPHRVDS